MPGGTIVAPGKEMLAPRMCRSTNRQVDPEIWFLILHLAQDGHKGTPVAAYREQMVEIALGPKGAFENGNISAMRRRVPTNSVVPLRGNPKPPMEPKTPRVIELLSKAIEWQTPLESGKIGNQADIARREGVSRARVTQIMGMLRLAPEIQEQIMSLPDSVRRFAVTDRILRRIETIPDYRDQLLGYYKLLR